MASTKNSIERPAPRTSYHVICIILLQFLVKFSQGQGPGVIFYIPEESPVGTTVGTINTTAGYTYTMPTQSVYFTLESSTGKITTLQVIDRESLTQDQINIFIIGRHSVRPSLPMEILVHVLDINDNFPVFQESEYPVAIPENSRTGSQQLLVTASDADKGENGTISSYRIISGNEENKFRLIPPSSITPFMYLEVQGVLDRENKDSYKLNVSASDGGTPPLYGFIQLDVTITDTNDNNPTFNPSEFEAKVNESAPVNTAVVTVHATDADKGLNSEIVYRLTDEHSEQFTVEERTGVIRTLRTPLSCTRICARSLRCNPSSCLITVEASDRGSPSLLGRAYITVIINDENDHDPIISFNHYPDRSKDFSTVDENVKPGKKIASVTVIDDDSGENGNTTLSIIGGNELGHFKLVTLFSQYLSINLIQVIGDLDREKVSMYNLTMKAVDHGYPQRSSTGHLIVYVSDANDHAPVFAKHEYRVKMSELELPGSFVESVTASDEDSGPNSALSYSIVTGNDLNWFRIDPSTGLVTTQDKLDHETTFQVIMNISAKDAGAQIFRNYTTLIVDISDENDVIPTFDRSVYDVKVQENVSVGSDIITLTATDTDEGLNGTVRYLFHPSVARSYPNTFQINSISGRIRTAKELDRETVPKYTILVIARDGGNPSLSSTASVIVSLNDVNDNAPTFRPRQYFSSILENQPSGTDVVQVFAFDPDEGLNRRITYSFFGDSFSSFSVDTSTGWVRTTKQLDKSRSPYRLTVRCTDGGGKIASPDASLEVTVANVNDPAPQFSGQSYTFSIEEVGENQIPDVSRSVGRVTATLSDNSAVTYAIVGGDPYGVFNMDRTSGQITTVKKVDREAQSEFHLKVIASGGSRFRETSVKVEVTDINDNSPVFVDQTLETSVHENWPIGRNIYHAEARDSDFGPNSDLSYTLTSNSNNVFMIKAQTGVIYLNKPLDQLPSNRSTHTLTVTATDAGTPQLSTTVDITVFIQDVNDHNPVYQSSHYERSIHESKPVNEPIFQLIAIDEDLGKNGALVYNITRGNLQHRFGIFPDGTLYVAHGLDREERDIYSLSVTVSDQGAEPRSSVANITFHILDDNDNKPVFGNSTYEFYVRENMPLRTFTGTVHATDADIGRNAEIIFSVGGDQTNFTINPQTGEVLTLKSFDREGMQTLMGRDYYAFEVTASDNGLKRLHETALVKVYVTDDNDNPPIFSKQIYTSSVMENAQLGVRLTTVTATDVDIGENGAISYVFLSGNEQKKFRIDETTGNVVLIAELDRETVDRYNLIILATDSVDVSNRLSATATLHITVMDFNDNIPLFVSPPSETSILESAQPGELIASFSAVDDDIANNAVLFFDINLGNNGNFFNLDRHMGKLYLNKPLDYENNQKFTLEIMVSDAGDGDHQTLSSSTSFVINVLDVNDNAPIFSDGAISSTVKEDYLKGRNVAAANAIDADSGPNGQILYSIIQQNPMGNNFQINPTTGDIYIHEMVDREVSELYTVTVMATDQATDPLLRLSSKKMVNLIILDVNDNAPTFKSQNTIPVSSSATRSVITSVEADDPDSGENGRISFSMVSGDNTLFSISSSGQLSLLKNFPVNPVSYSLTIKASDHGQDNGRDDRKSTNMDFTVLVVSQNGGPIFSSPSYSSGVQENKPVGTSVLQVDATSSQSGLRVEYYLTDVSGSVGRIFDINKSTGRLTTEQVLDREKLPEYVDVTIYAALMGGNGPRTRSTQARIRIVDENDTPPRFSSSLFLDTISESAQLGQSVLTVDVTDPDTIGSTQLQLNGNGAEDFSITQDGTLKTARVLSRSRRRSYAFRVQASDGQQTSFSDVQITVEDENDHPPEFTHSFYSFDVPENTAIGTTVASVTAIDQDEASNGQVTYDLVSDWGKSKFQVEGSLGTITLIDQLDFEEVQLYTLNISANDGGSPPLISSVTVYMNVKDVNDNTPVFDPMSYSQEIWENAAIGTTLLNVSATDIDTGINSQLRYSLAGGDKKNQFDIGPLNGTIYTIGFLNRETIPTYHLIVIATDQAEPPSDRLSTSATVTIHLKDVNDCPPEFKSPNATWVKEDASRASVVFTVVATDADSGPNGQVSYSLASVPGFGYPFTLDQASGYLQVNTALDRETIANYSLTITATDKGQPSLSATQNLIVHIEDVNDNAPNFVKQTYGATVPEDIGVGKSLLKVSATDLDEGLNGIIRYYIIRGDENYDFNLDMSSGVLRIQKNLDYERNKLYNLIVQAEDSGVHVVNSATASIVINVTDVNDNAPVFVDSPYIAFVQENNKNIPVHLMQVTARDDDSTPNSQLTYSLLDDDGIFQIQGPSGEITVHQTLDREATAEYQLIIFAKDSGSPRLTGSGTIKVLVQDVNDHPPVFDNTQYTGHVPENLPSPTSVLSVRATDQDEGENAEIVYSLENSMGEKFTIYPDTGQIVTLAMLDREERNEYDLVVIASDRGIPPQSATTKVVIHVDDANDNSPEFEQQSYSQVVLSPTARGAFVLGVTAIDRDIGSNGQVRYSLSGADASKFVINANSGVITAGQELSQSGSRYNLVVRASDQGGLPNSNSVNVRVDMMSYSESKPVFSPFDANLSVKENSLPGKILTTVTATTTRTNQILYYIAGGNVNRGFGINQLNGSISVLGSIDFETTRSFELWIEANDGGNPALSEYKMMRVSVEDDNDNAPRFQESSYNTSIPENVQKGYSVKQLSATDLDSNENGQITYTIHSGNTNTTFQVDAQTGLISTNNIVDREGIDLFHLIVQAKDKGTPSLTTTATVTIHILDENDNPPKFTRRYSLSVPENVPLNCFIVQMTTSDKDIGNNAKSTFWLQNDQDKLNFAIDSISGNISTVALLDAETVDRYYPRVIAKDANFQVETQVFIKVQDVNDNAPVFREDTLSFDFQERQAANAVVGRLRAMDADLEQPNNQYIFSLKRPSDVFEINAETGDITALQTLYYRHVPDHPLSVNRYTLDVVVSDLGTPSLSSENMVIITVIDANNHPPQFVQSSYFSAVPENRATGDLVITILAVDENDYGINAEVFYAVAGGNGSQFFQIDQDTGFITVKASLQGRQNADYLLFVKAQDKGTPPQSTTVDVHFKITDVNNFAPVFTTQIFQKTITEDTPIGQTIQTFSATDNDPGINGQVMYLITTGNELGLFGMGKESGALTVAKALDFDTHPTHLLTVVARDKALVYQETNRTFTLHLTDVNDNPPVFNQTYYDAYIPENSAPSTSFYTLHATDADSGDNAIIHYSVVGNSIFTIEKETGILRSQGNLDYEVKDAYSVTIMAYNPSELNGGSDMKKTVVAVHVHVVGVNEYFPQFEKTRYNFRVSESATINSSIGSVLATDQDKGIDGIVYYFLIGSSNLRGFRIDHQTGVIHVAGRPDYESSQEIILNVMAKNWGSIQGNDTDTCQVFVTIEDANDPPVFSRNIYEATVSENSLQDTYVIKVEATDNDYKPENRQFVYTILRGNDGNRFKIDRVNGEIRTTGQGYLDRETQDQFNVTVGAVDSGLPPQTGSAVVKIRLQDVNDNGPYFDPIMPEGHIQENRDAGQFVMSLPQFTKDRDLPPNQAPYRYRMVSSSDKFKIYTQTGRVETIATLDREQTPEFTLPVVVTDGGIPTMTSTLTFKIVVGDVNDNPPRPRPLVIQLMILQGMSSIGLVADVRPLDDDAIGNYSCNIESGDTNTFNIYQNCDLRVIGSVDEKTYNLRIRGSDGMPSHPASEPYDVSVTVSEYKNATVDNSVPMLVADLSARSFLEDKYPRFVNALKNAFSPQNSFTVYSLKEMGTDLIVFLSVQKPNGDHIPKTSMQQTLETNKQAIESTASISIRSTSYSACQNHQCQNGGKCDSEIVMHPGYSIHNSPSLILTSAKPEVKPTCICPPSFAGDFCETPIGPCGESYCYNGGTCIQDVCHCTPQWNGPSCQQDVNECLSDPCVNGGSCVNLDGTFRCDCPDGFHGDVCESTMYCTSRPCWNGGSCNDVPGGYTCDCVYGYFGSRCEKSSKGFSEGSFLEFPPLSNLNNTDITLFFATNKRNALLFLSQATVSPTILGFVALEIIDGNVRFSFKFTSVFPKVLQVNRGVSDGRWYRVQVQKVTEGAILKVQHCPNGNSTSCEECAVGHPSCYVFMADNGSKVVESVDALNIGGVRNISNVLQYAGDVQSHDFVGCAHSFEVNGIDMLDIKGALHAHGVSDKCPRSNSGSQCALVSCQNGGQCVDEWTTTRCQCTKDYMGDKCEEEWKPFGFGPDSTVEYKVRENFRRDTKVAEMNSRGKRAVGSSKAFLRFRTTKSSGNLLYVAINNKKSYVWVSHSFSMLHLLIWLKTF
ncbi:protocadherin Fat 4-like [Haliotis cracherodii]|uniref:protocadherin Fat 4-like n=1 Tax=Haliotis cracherodii TaxID=6455 RepID=UPI0039ED24C1